MKQQDAIILIQNAVDVQQPEQWADLGCGSGTFTNALLALLPSASTITAVDQQTQRFDEPAIRFHRADIINDELPLKHLDGILMANVFHFVADKERLIGKLEGYFAGPPRFLLVDYDTDRANRWVPYPVSFQNLSAFFLKSGYTCTQTGKQPSAFGGMLYSALAIKV